MSFKADDFEGMKEKKEKKAKEPLKVEDLVQRSNELLGKHEKRLKEFPPRFQAALHDEMVQFFRTSADHFDRDREQGLNAMEFEKYSQAMLEKLHGILEQYAPEKEKAKEKSENAGKGLEDGVEEPMPEQELENVTLDSSKLGTPEGIQGELKKFDQQSKELVAEGHGLRLKIGRFQEIYQDYLKEKKGWDMFTRRFGTDEKTQQFEQKLNDFKKDLGEKLKALEIKKKELAEYARDQLNPAGDRLRHNQVTEREKLMEQFGNDPEKQRQFESHYADVLKSIDAVDAQVTDRVLNQNLQMEFLLSQLTGQKAFYESFKIEAPGYWDATVGLLFERIGDGWRKMLVEGLSETILDGASEWCQKKTKGIPVVETGTKIATNIVLGLPSGLIEGTGELIHGFTTLVAHPIDSAKGISILIPVYNPVNGEWFDFPSAGKAWKEMGKAVIAYDTFAEGNVGKGISKTALNVALTVTGAGAISKGAHGARIAYLVSRTEAGVLKSSLKAVAAGTPIFVSDFSKGVAKIPGEIAAIPGRMMEKLPSLLATILKADDVVKIQLRMQQVMKRLEEARDTLKTMMIDGKNVNDMNGLKGKSCEELARLGAEELKDLGLGAKGSIEEFLRYKDALKTVESLTMALEALKLQDRLMQINPELLQFSSLEGQKLDEFITKFNERNPGGYKEHAFTLVKRGAGEVVALDQEGRLKKYMITGDTAPDILKEIKAADRAGVKSYELRQECMWRSEGALRSIDVFTFEDIPETWGWNKMMKYLRDPNSWLPERREFHRGIVRRETDNTLQLSEKLDQAEPIVVMLRGNTGSGKSYYLKHNDPFQGALDENRKLPGVINPDTYKQRVIENEKREGGKMLSSGQTHSEARFMADEVIEGARMGNPQLTEVWDQRFTNINEIGKKVKEAKKAGKKINIIDLDAPLETSCIRVLCRPEIGSAPRTGFRVIADGFRDTRNTRGELLKIVKKEQTVSNYTLRVADKSGNSTIVFEKKDGVIGEIKDQSLFDKALSNTDSEIERVGSIQINDDYLKTLDPETRKKVEKYKKDPPITLEAAIEKHAGG